MEIHVDASVTLDQFIDEADSNANWASKDGSPEQRHWKKCKRHLKKAKRHATLAKASHDISEDEYLEAVSLADNEPEE